MIISKVKYEELVRSRDRYEALAEETIKSNERLLDMLKHVMLTHPESYVDDVQLIVGDMTIVQKKALLAYLEESIERNKEPITKEEWEEVSHSDLH